MTITRNTSEADRLFIGVYPCGIVYADRSREEGGDYARLAFLAYDTLELKVEPTCPADLREEVTEHAADIQARKGEHFRISTVGQTVLLGRAVTKRICSEKEKHHA